MLNSNSIKHAKTTSYHPHCNGFVERSHKDLKRAINALEDRTTWSKYLPYIVLQMNNLRSDDNAFTAHQRLFGQAANLPGQILFPPEQLPGLSSDINTQIFQALMSRHKRHARPLPDIKTYCDPLLNECEYVYVKNEQTSGSYKSPWKGPYRVITRGPKFFSLEIKGRSSTVSIDRLKVSLPLKIADSKELHQTDHKYNLRYRHNAS